MQKGTKVAIHSGPEAHPRIRGRHGFVQGPGYNGSVLVKLEDGYESNIDRSLLEVLAEPEPEPIPVTD